MVNSSDENKEMGFKYCIVPRCESTSKSTPNKWFFYVPKDPYRRRLWIKAMKRKNVSPNSSMYCCEDHFSLENDMKNYWQWNLTRDVRRLVLKSETVPHQFDCQKTSDPIERKAASKRKRKPLVEEGSELSCTSSVPKPVQVPEKEPKSPEFQDQFSVETPYYSKANYMKKLLTMASKDTPLSSGTEITVKSELLDDRPSSSNSANKNEEDVLQMDVDCNAQPNDDEKDSFFSKIKIDTIADGLTELSVESPYFDVSGEEVIMSPEDVRKYLDSKIREYIIDAEVNKLMKLYKRSLELKEVLREKNEEYLKIQKLMEMIFRNQERFLRQGGIVPKIPTYSRGISVDLTFLPPTESLKLPKLFLDSNAAQSKTVATPKPALNPSLASNPSPVPASNPPTPSPSGNKSSIECIDLTDEQDSSDKQKGPGSPRSTSHPAPLPPRPYSAPNESYLRVPPRPRLQVKGDSQGIVLQWDLSSTYNPKVHAQVTAYEIFGYQVLPKNAVCTLLWKKIGTVKAMTLPMACTLTQFQEGNKYFFAIRAVDNHNRCSHFSEALSIIYNSRKEVKVAK